MLSIKRKSRNDKNLEEYVSNRVVLASLLEKDEWQSELYRRTNRVALMLAYVSRATRKAVAERYCDRKLRLSGRDSAKKGAPAVWGLFDILHLAAANQGTAPLKVVCMAPRSVNFAQCYTADALERLKGIMGASTDRVEITLVSSQPVSATEAYMETRGPAIEWPLLPTRVGGCLVWETEMEGESEELLQCRWNPYGHTDDAERYNMGQFLCKHVAQDRSETTIVTARSYLAHVVNSSTGETHRDMKCITGDVAEEQPLERLSVSLPRDSPVDQYFVKNSKWQMSQSVQAAMRKMHTVYTAHSETIKHISMHVPDIKMKVRGADCSRCTVHTYADYVDWAAAAAESAPDRTPFLFDADVIEKVLFTMHGSIAIGIGEVVAVTDHSLRGACNVFTLKIHIDVVSMRFGGICGREFANGLIAALRARTACGDVVVVEDLTVTLHRDTDKDCREDVFLDDYDAEEYECTVGVVRDLLSACGAVGAHPWNGRGVKCEALTLRFSPTAQTPHGTGSHTDNLCSCPKLCAARLHHAAFDLPSRLLASAHGEGVPCADNLRVPTACLHSLLSQTPEAKWHVRSLEAFSEPDHGCTACNATCAKSYPLNVPDVDGFDFPADEDCKYATLGPLLETMTVDADPEYIVDPHALQQYIGNVTQMLGHAPEILKTLDIRFTTRRRHVKVTDWPEVASAARNAVTAAVNPPSIVEDTAYGVCVKYKGRARAIRVRVYMSHEGHAPERAATHACVLVKE